MDPQLKDEWLEALRSGRYAQGQGCLRSHNVGDDPQEDSFCCLGVLADIMMGTNPGAWTSGSNGSVPMTWTSDDYGDDHYEEAELPYYLQEIAGISHDDCDTLMEMNDGPGESEAHSFKQLANHIEEYL